MSPLWGPLTNGTLAPILRDMKSAVTGIEVGMVVEVGPSYRMGGYFEPDGFEGIYTVAQITNRDIGLVRGVVEGADEGDTDVWFASTSGRVKLLVG
jgi:hypothetical protein